MLRWPVLETGRNSVMPSTMPRRTAWNQFIVGLSGWGPGARGEGRSCGSLRERHGPAEAAEQRTACSDRRAAGTPSRRGGYLVAMQQRSVGATGLKVSRLGLGTMTWGRDTDEHEARDQLIAFVESGGNLLDTAAGYGGGASEELDRHARGRRRPAGRGRARHQGRHQREPRRAAVQHLARAPALHARRLAAPARRRPRRPVAGAHLVRRRPAGGGRCRRSTSP